MSKTVACMKWGTRYGPEFANRLYRAVRRNVTGSLRFVCFTEDPAGLDPDIDAQPLPPINLPERVAWTPWRKLSLWQAPLAGLFGDVLALDLDLVVTGSLDDFFTYRPGAYCVIENWTQKGKGIGNTSAFRIPVGRYTHIFDRINLDPESVLGAFRIEQHYISHYIPEQTLWPPEWCLSFKHSVLPRFPMNWVRTPELPAGARIVAFTGHPDPDEALVGAWPAPIHKRFYKRVRPTPWIAEHWR
ncbi:MAG: hypothetical protein ACE5FO_00020 [Parvularculaceae bacterium]